MEQLCHLKSFLKCVTRNSFILNLVIQLKHPRNPVFLPPYPFYITLDMSIYRRFFHEPYTYLPFPARGLDPVQRVQHAESHNGRAHTIDKFRRRTTFVSMETVWFRNQGRYPNLIFACKAYARIKINAISAGMILGWTSPKRGCKIQTNRT